MIVATGRIDILRKQTFTAIVCSTEFREPVQDDEVLLPSNPDGSSETGFRHPTVAVCNWRANLSITEVKAVGDFIKGEVLREVLAKAGIALPSER